MKKIPKEVWIGLFATMALLLLFIGINFLKGDDLFTGRNTYYSVLNDVKGLKTSAPVLFKGLKAGTVTDIELNPEEGFVLVTVEVSKKIKLTRGTTFRLVSTDLFDTKALQIDPGPSGSPLYRDSDTLPALIAPSLIENLVGDLTPLKDKVEVSLTNVNRILEALQSEQIRQSVENLNRGTRDLSLLIQESRGPVQQTLADLSSITGEFRKDQPILRKSLKNLEQFSDSLADLRLKQTVLQAEAALQSTAMLMDQIRNNQGTLGRLMRDSSLYLNLQQSAGSLDALLSDLKKNPGRYVQFSVFGKKSP
ncbi:MAG: MlaD family protein [Bacteroidia bacterium]|jgi:phospholipid/cholesterol/gamma-HCH transport system substrate-binding protein